MKFFEKQYKLRGGKKIYPMIPSLISYLDSQESKVREKARIDLINIGPPVIEFLADIVDSDKDIVRWEVVKILVQIEDPLATPLLIKALEDDKGSIRWLASEGLIHLGDLVIIPLLIALQERAASIFLRAGAHHVLQKIKPNIPEEKQVSLMHSLKNGQVIDNLPLLAKHALMELEASSESQV